MFPLSPLSPRSRPLSESTVSSQQRRAFRKSGPDKRTKPPPPPAAPQVQTAGGALSVEDAEAALEALCGSRPRIVQLEAEASGARAHPLSRSNLPLCPPRRRARSALLAPRHIHSPFCTPFFRLPEATTRPIDPPSPFRTQCLEAAWAEAQAVAAAAGHPERGAQLVSSLRDRIARAQWRAAAALAPGGSGGRARVACVQWTDPLYIAGGCAFYTPLAPAPSPNFLSSPRPPSGTLAPRRSACLKLLSPACTHNS